MKFWTKTYFYVLILFLMVFNISICLIMSKTYQSMVDSEKKKASSEYYFIKQSLKNDMELLDSNNKLSDSSMKNLIDYYSSYYKDQNMSFLLENNNSVIFSNLQCSMNSIKSNIKNTNDGQNISLQSQNGAEYIIIYSTIDYSVSRYNLIYCYRLDMIMNVWNKLKATFIYFSFIISIILALSLAIMLNGRSKPLKKLIVFVNQMKDGNYTGKVKISGRDEFAVLGENFNEMSEKIRNTVQQLNSDMKMKQQFIDNLSHELRTPLTSIYGYAEYIQKAAISEEDKYEATKYIMEESRRLQYMSNRLLDITIRRQTKIIKSEINVEELFEKVLKTISSHAEEKFITINISNSLSFIIGEQQLIESLLINILDNAIKASEDNQSIEIIGFSSNKGAMIQVIDKGKGISKEHIAHITEPFYRADKARSKSEGGTGLGLALCKQIMDMHKGELLITSELNKGTTVSLTFTTS
ncbi:MAG: HAMP domain-containing sensor histidine kinase [Bacillota bacterium]|nr:HAMP domain-containing sensor histidine kinase [Bacillota bacterium]